MATAVFRTGGKQYRVSVGDTVQVDRLDGNPGDKVQFGEVLLISGDAPQIGQPTVTGAKVEAEIVAQTRGPKLVVFKMRRRKKSRQKKGHRQDITAVKITAIAG
jgi:large subunit ribosomal protein L21